MPVSGRRYAALQRQAAEQRADILRLERDLTTVTGERDAAREIVRGLSDRNRELVARPLTGDETALVRLLRQSEEGPHLSILQAANVES
jgi:hypothetical protein